MRPGTHLSGDQLIDLVEDRADEPVRAHAVSCADCAARVAPLRLVLERLADDRVPEPDPWFWARLSDRVEAAVITEGEQGRGWWRVRWNWKSAAALTLSAAGVVLAVVLLSPSGRRTDAVPGGPDARMAAAVIDPAPLPAEDGVFDLVAAIVGRMSAGESGGESFVLAPGTVEQAARQLSPEAQDALVRLLEEELAGRPS